MDKTQANDLAWLGGFLDGEGSINLDCYNKGDTLIVTPRIRFTNSEPNLIKHTKEILTTYSVGVFIQTKEARTLLHKDGREYRGKGLSFDVTVSGYKRCRKLIDLIYDHVVSDSKKVRLELMKELIDSRLSRDDYKKPYNKEELAIIAEFKLTKPQRLNTNPF
jgi:hypothetical protein